MAERNSGSGIDMWVIFRASARQHQGHDYFPVQSLEQRLLHEADCDELRSRAEETASSLREHYHRQYARKAKAHNCPP
ncbi:protein YncJ [Klebsiella aerogenes]|nr:protein YncJ [Klebsiella aerogenes]